MIFQLFQFGTIENPYSRGGLNVPALNTGTSGQGLFLILNSLVKFIVVIAGLYTFFNLVLAGYGFISAGGDPKSIQKAWDKIWQSLLGLLVVTASFILAGVFGYLLFGDATALLTPRIFHP